MAKQSILVFLVCFSLQCVFCAQLPSNINKCHFGDSKCLIASMNDVIMRYSKGIPEVGMKPFDVIYEDKVVLFDPPKSLPYYMYFEIIKAAIKGFENSTVMRVEGFESDPTKTSIEIQIEVPSIKMIGPYLSIFKFLVVDINTTGHISLDAQNVRVTWTAGVMLVPRNKSRYLKITNSALVIQMDRIITKMEDYYVANTDLSLVLNNAMNHDWTDFWREIEPVVIPRMSKLLIRMISPVLEHIAYDDLFLQETIVQKINDSHAL